MEKFKGTTKELKGPEYDVTTEPLDHALVMISGEGKKHGKEAIAGGMFPSSSRSSLPEYKARLGISKSSTYKRSTPAMVEMEPDWRRRGEWRRRRGQRRGDWLMRGRSRWCSRRCWHKLVNALQCLGLIVPRMVCPLCRCLNQAMDLILMDLHMHEAQATTTLVVLRMFEIEYGCHLDALWTTTWT
ncbi:hypothetical protein VPH35_129847 [Triticum aestivum]